MNKRAACIFTGSLFIFCVMDVVKKAALLEYLQGFISPQRKAIFDEKIRYRTRHITLALEDIFQSHNASAVLRSCDCFGIQEIHVIENTNRFRAIPTVSLGANQWVSVQKHNQREENTQSCFAKLREQGYRIIATTPHKEETHLEDLDITSPVALVFGQELRGLSEEALSMADGFMKVPMYGFSESLNISVCAAICLHHLRYRLMQSEVSWQLSYEEELDVRLKWARSSIKKCAEIEKHFLKG